jgi:hypothetical protein
MSGPVVSKREWKKDSDNTREKKVTDGSFRLNMQYTILVAGRSGVHIPLARS